MSQHHHPHEPPHRHDEHLNAGQYHHTHESPHRHDEHLNAGQLHHTVINFLMHLL